MSNPLIQQGSINRLRGSVQVASYQTLNVTAGYLGKGGITLALEGTPTEQEDTMTGMVNSPVPFLPAVLHIHLLRTQTLHASWRAQMESDSTLGNVTVKTDTPVDPDYNFRNMSIVGVEQFSFAGADPGYLVTCRGIYDINSTMWNPPA